MKRWFCVRVFLAAFLFGVVSVHAENVCIGTDSSTHVYKGSLFLPDFAYPADVARTARAFLEAHPASAQPGSGSLRLLAAQEEALAQLDIDRQSINRVTETLLEFADAETDATTRAMFLAYTAWLCREKAWCSSGYLDEPIRSEIDRWGFRAFHVAADSLYRLAYDIAPERAPLEAYAAALKPLAKGPDIVTTVRDFIITNFTRNLSFESKKGMKPAKGTPLAVINSIYRLRNDSLRRAAVDSLLGTADAPYAVAGYLMKFYPGSDPQPDYDLLCRVAKTPLPAWIEAAVDSALCYIKMPQWTVSFADVATAGVPFPVVVNSANTDSISLDLYRYESKVRAEKEYPRGCGFYRRVTFRPASGIRGESMCDTITLPAGYYIAKYAGSTNKIVNRVEFCVSPWTAVYMQTTPVQRQVQILDAMTGAPVRNVRVKATRTGNKRKTLTVRTDSRGIASFKCPIRSDVTVSDAKTGEEYNVNAGWMPWWSSEYEPRQFNDADKNIRQNVFVSLGTDRTIYHPGDTLRWIMVAQRDGLAVEHHEGVIKAELPTGPNSASRTESIHTQPTDIYGRTSGQFIIPSATALGRGSLSCNNAYVSFSVSDFRLPELSIDSLKYIFAADSVIIGGKVINNVGNPRGGISVCLINGNTNARVDTVTTSTNGMFVFRIARFDETHSTPNEVDRFLYRFFRVEASTPDGYNATGDIGFNPYRDVDVSVKTADVTDMADGLTFDITTRRLGSETPDQPVECLWKLVRQKDFDAVMPLADKPENGTPVLQGVASTGRVIVPAARLQNIKAGVYTLCVETKTEYEANARQRIILYNPAKPELPVDAPVWMPRTEFGNIRSDSVKVLVGAADDGVVLWWAETTTKQTDVPSSVNSMILHKGYQEVTFGTQAPQSVELWCAYRGKFYENTLFFASESNGAEASSDTLSVSLESFRETAMAGTSQHWTVVTRQHGKPVGAAVCLNVYEKRLFTLGLPASLRFALLRNADLSGFTSSFSEGRFNYAALFSMRLYPRRYSVGERLESFVFPSWRFTNTFVYGAHASNIAVVEQSAPTAALARGSASVKMAAIEKVKDLNDEATVDDSASEVGGTVTTADVAVRRGTILNALWMPDITTDSITGRADIDFMLPNQTSTWAVKVTAWTKNLRNREVTSIFTATKPLTVKPNLPRFVRVGDCVDIVTTVTNTTDTAQSVDYDVTVCGNTSTGKLELGPRMNTYVTTSVAIGGAAALADSLDFTFRVTNGRYGDGERVVIPVLASSALITESTPFYVNYGDTTVTLQIPQVRGDSVRTELHFTSNPMMRLLESAQTLLSPDIEEAVLSTDIAGRIYIAVTFDSLAAIYPEMDLVAQPENLQSVRKKALKRLEKFQHEDGGFAWGVWSDRSTLTNTLQVLSWFDQDTASPDLKPMVDKALAYADRMVAESPFTGAINMLYALVRGAYGQPDTPQGTKVIANTVNYLRGNWKSLSLNDKCVAALIMHRNGHNSVANEILESVRQYGTVTPDRGLIFRNMPGVTAYANMLEAWGAVRPSDTFIDAVRQALLCMRRGQSWGNSARTAYAIRALITTGTTWGRTARNVKVSVDGVPVALPQEANRYGVFETPVCGKEVKLNFDADGPAYGALVTRRVAELTDVAAFGTPELSVAKTIYTLNAQGRRVRAEETNLRPGQKIIVSLLLKADTDMTDIMVEDSRSAAFEPVEQTGRSLRAENGTWYYLLNRAVSTGLYVDRLPRGYTELTYEAIVNNAGTFATGIAESTSGIDADISAHSSSQVFIVEPALMTSD